MHGLPNLKNCFTSYVLKLKPHVSETQSLSVFRLASYKTTVEMKFIQKNLCLEEGWLKTGTDTVPQNFIALYISIYKFRKSIKSMNSEVMQHRKNLISSKSKLVAFDNTKISRENPSLWKNYFL